MNLSYSSIILLIVLAIASSSSWGFANAFHLMRNTAPSSPVIKKQFLQNSVVYPCVCSQRHLCESLKTPLAEKEFLMFQTNKTNWKTYDFKYVTSIALFGGYDPEILCTAHEKNIRILYATDGLPPDQLFNKTARDEFTTQVVETVVLNSWDGIQLDAEEPIAKGSSQESDLTLFARELQQKLKKANPYASFSMDVAWSANNIDGRNYQYNELVEICDFVAIMDYDTRSQVFSGPPCYAGPNTPASSLFEGVASYLRLPSASPRKLVLGMPWYGYTYPALNENSIHYKECQIPSVPFRGVKCSDAAGGQIIFSDIMKIVRNESIAKTAVMTDLNMSKSGDGSYATFNYAHFDSRYNTNYQTMFFDNPETLSEKYKAAKDLNLRGLAIWSVDMIYVTGSESKIDAKEMWDAFGSFV